MASRGARGRRKRGAGAGTSAAPESSTSDANSGPSFYPPPISEFPLQYKDDFGYAVNPLREYDDRKYTWPKCLHGLDCVVQMFHGDHDGGRRFFRCPNGDYRCDHENCGFTKWVDPMHIAPTQEYITYLQDRIVQLEMDLENATLNPTPSQDNIVITDDNFMCSDPYCKCPHHKPGPTNHPPPPPPPSYYAPGGYYDDVGQSQSADQNSYTSWN